MKRLSLLVAILLIATIGGVYATWNYAGTTKDIGVQEYQAITLESAVQDGAAGSYTLTHNLKTIAIAPNNQDEKLAVLVPTFTDGSTQVKLTLTFTPSTNAGDEIEANALTSYVYLGTERTFTYGEPATEIFTFEKGKTAPITIGAANSTEPYKWTKIGASFTCEITLDFEDVIAFAQEIRLPTIDDFNAFLAALGNAHTINMHLHISNINPAA